jgi:uracil-DNA glycosylase
MLDTLRLRQRVPFTTRAAPLAMVLALLVTAGADVRSLCLYSKPQTVLELRLRVATRTSKWIAFRGRRCRRSSRDRRRERLGRPDHPIHPTGSIDSGWATALAPVAGVIAKLGDFLDGEVAAGAATSPPRKTCSGRSPTLLRMFVLIVGQDPYPSLASIGSLPAVDRAVRPIPREPLEHLQRARATSGVAAPHGTGRVVGPGVMLLSRVLTVQPGESGSHRRTGWEAVTATAIHALADRGGPLVAILWGRTLSPRSRCSAPAS